MSEYKTQKAEKPTVEDVAQTVLQGEKLTDSVDFVKFLRDNKLTPRWASANSWSIRYKGKGLCYVKINSRSGDWDARIERSLFDVYDRYICDEGMKSFVLDIVNPPQCPGRECWKRMNETLLGRTFDEVCRCWPFRVNNPHGEALEKLKKLVLVSKGIIADMDAAKA